ncbi:MAG: hypothetical protein KF791_01360, partial [Verrucomicrobiae bacterium]|nr:hypothetical protein [Verrucomicrobiae bacterium]
MAAGQEFGETGQSQLLRGHLLDAVAVVEGVVRVQTRKEEQQGVPPGEEFRVWQGAAVQPGQTLQLAGGGEAGLQSARVPPDGIVRVALFAAQRRERHA